MAVPVAYTETSLAEYMHAVLGKTATALGWTVPDRYAEPVNDALLIYGESDIAEATEIENLRACARYAAWKAVWAEVAGDFDFSEDGQSYRRSQRVKHVAAMLRDAELDLEALGISPTSMVEILAIEHSDDPYTYRDDASEEFG